ncbi:MAG: 3-oxoacyl-ACP reductase FabG [Alphaproteobacteria bacterium]|nr:3-oxoacyl-ACP reductase FabG [Alphaproteobacteria bacterium]
MFAFNNSRALITGGAGRIGLRTAVALAKQGASIVIVDAREEKLRDAVKIIKEETGIDIDSFACNLLDIEATKELFYTLEDTFGQIDILINNAGIDKDKLLMKMTEDDLDMVMNVNFKAPFLLSQAAAMRMSKRNFGRIINISSVVAFTGNKGQANYCSSKSALLGMSKSIALEYAKRGITVNCIAPGAIKTPMIDVLSDEAKESFLNKIPVGFFGSPDDVASAVVFLASKEAEYITGQTIHVNGGMFMF